MTALADVEVEVAVATAALNCSGATRNQRRDAYELTQSLITQGAVTLQPLCPRNRRHMSLQIMCW